LREKKRKELTEFGSGWRGLLSLPELLQPLVKQRGMSMSRERLATFLTEKVSSAAEKKALSEFLFSAGRSPFEEIAVINPLAIRVAAQKQGIAYSKALKGTIAHERFHQRMASSKLRGSIDIKVPTEFANRFKGKSPEVISEEYIAYAIESGYLAPKHVDNQAARSYFKQKLLPAMNLRNTIEGFGEIGMSSLNRKGYGFGSGSIWNKILTFARSVFKNPKSQSAMERLTSPMSQSEIATVFGKETSSFNPSQIRSGLMDKWYVNKRMGLPVDLAKKPLHELDKEIKMGEMAYNKADIEGRILGKEQIRLMSDTEWKAFRDKTQVSKQEASQSVAVLKSKSAKIQQNTALHRKAQKDLWSNPIGHVTKTSTRIN